MVRKGVFLSRRGFLSISLSGAVAATGMLLGGCDRLGQFSGSNAEEGFVADPGHMGDPEEQVLSEEEFKERRLDDFLAGMSIEHKVAQMLIAKPEVLAGSGELTQASEATRNALQKTPLGGVTYFANNLLNTKQASAMLANTRQYALDVNGIPPFLGVDEEGGTVSRIGGSPGFGAQNVGNMRDIGATQNPARARSAAEYVAGYLKPLGLNVNFAPVCDIATVPNSEMILRSFGSDPALVASMVAAQVEAFSAEGLLCTAKHFPGIGFAADDSHEDLITTNSTLDDLYAKELVPFEAAIQAGIPLIMVGHVAVPAVTGNNTPASLSPALVQTLLREELGYEGLIITDSLGMGAVSTYHGIGESVVLAIQAGCDLALMPAELGPALDGVLEALKDGVLSEDRIDQSVRRILRTKVEALGDFTSGNFASGA